MTVTEERPTQEVGTARRRKEDARLITGRTRWTDNIQLPGMLHMAMVRSPFARAAITSIDTSAAKQSPGVLTVLTGPDIAEEQGASLPCAWPITEDQKAPDHPAMAVERVNFAGEIVACRRRAHRGRGTDAAELVDVEYAEETPILDMGAAAEDGAALTYPELGTNVSATWVYDSGEAGSGTSVDDELANSDIVLERTYRQQRLIPSFMEPRSIVVDPTGEQTVMWSATQIPHILKIMLALTTGVPESKLRVVAPDVGGGFGGKLQVTPEEVITLVVSRRIGKPCKYTETRSESLMVAHHGRDQIQKLTLGDQERRHGDGVQGRPARRHGCLPRPGHVRYPDPRRLHVQRHLQVPVVPVHLHATCSRTRPGPTPTAVLDGPRRRTRSSA